MIAVEFPFPTIAQVVADGKINRANGLTADGNDSAVSVKLAEQASTVLMDDSTLFMHWCYGTEAAQDVALGAPQYVDTQQPFLTFNVPLALLKLSAGKTVFVYYKYIEPGSNVVQVVHQIDAVKFAVDSDIAQTAMLAAPDVVDDDDRTLSEVDHFPLRVRVPADKALVAGVTVDVTVACHPSGGPSLVPDRYSVQEKVTVAGVPFVVAVPTPAWPVSVAGTVTASYTVNDGTLSSKSTTVPSHADAPASVPATLWACGAGGHFGRGDGTNTVRESFDKVGAPHLWKSVTKGGTSHLAISEDGRLFGWGMSNYGQVGARSLVDVEVPTECWFGESRLMNIRHASTSLWYSLALDANGGLWMSGKPNAGTAFYGSVFRKLSDGPFSAVSAGSGGDGGEVDACYCSLAIAESGQLMGWGASECDLLGVTGGPLVALPQPVAGIESLKWRSVVHDREAVAAITRDGDLYMWGKNYADRDNLAGAGGSEGQDMLVPPGNGRVTVLDNLGEAVKWSKVALGREHVLAVDAKKRLWGWGQNVQSGLARGPDEVRVPPSQILADHAIVDVCANPYRGAALTEQGHVYAWGANVSHQLGLPGNTAVFTSPTLVTSQDHVSAIEFGAQTIFLLSTNQTTLEGTGVA